MLFRKSLSSRLTSEYEYFACKHLYNWNSPTRSFVWFAHSLCWCSFNRAVTINGHETSITTFSVFTQTIRVLSSERSCGEFLDFCASSDEKVKKKIAEQKFRAFDLKKLSFFKQTKNCRWKRKLSSSLIISFVIYFSAVNLNKF